MADIVLAESGGRTWLVTGEMYIDDLLAGTLPANITIEFVACEIHIQTSIVCGRRASGDERRS